jgi:hypothetical protein
MSESQTPDQPGVKKKESSDDFDNAFGKLFEEPKKGEETEMRGIPPEVKKLKRDIEEAQPAGSEIPPEQ